MAARPRCGRGCAWPALPARRSGRRELRQQQRTAARTADAIARCRTRPVRDLCSVSMARVHSQKCPMRGPDYTDRQPRPECLKQMTSPDARQFCVVVACAGCIARQTASPVTAGDGLNDYLVARCAVHRAAEENSEPRPRAVTESALPQKRGVRDVELRYIRLGARRPRNGCWSAWHES